MKTLTLVRHAKSSWKDTSLADRDRPLNKRGKRDAPEMGRRLTAAGVRPSLIVSSPAVRAWTTAKIIANEIGYPREFLQRDSALYLASVNGILDVIASQDTGFNKPQPEIFREALTKAGVEASEVIYVGDQYQIDAVGASKAGMEGMLLDRGDDFKEVTDCPRIRSLSNIVKHL